MDASPLLDFIARCAFCGGGRSVISIFESGASPCLFFVSRVEFRQVNSGKFRGSPGIDQEKSKNVFLGFRMYEKYRVGQKVSCCIAGCNFVNYGLIFKEIPLLESLLNFQKDAFY